MTVNKENIQKVIDLISKDDGTHFRMNSWVVYVDSSQDRQTTPTNGWGTDEVREYIDCSTAFCVAGYANLIRLEEKQANPKAIIGDDFRAQFANSWRAAEWLGINNLEQHFDELFMNGMEYNEIREEFDALPAKARRQVAIDVLSHLRDTGEIDWNTHIENAKRA